MLKALASMGKATIGVDMEPERPIRTTSEFLKGLGFMIAHGLSNRLHKWTSRSKNFQLEIYHLGIFALGTILLGLRWPRGSPKGPLLCALQYMFSGLMRP